MAGRLTDITAISMAISRARQPDMTATSSWIAFGGLSGSKEEKTPPVMRRYVWGAYSSGANKKGDHKKPAS